MRFSRGQDWPGKATDSGAIVVTESRPQVGILFGFLVLALAVALARGVTGAQTTSGRVAAAVFGSILVVAFIASWIVMTRRPARMEVTDTVIVLGFSPVTQVYPAIHTETTRRLGAGDWRPSLNYLEVRELLTEPPAPA